MNRPLYTTTDVIAWWSDLEARGRHELLETERRWLHHRRWSGDGMAVDVGRLARWMAAYERRRRGILHGHKDILRSDP